MTEGINKKETGSMVEKEPIKTSWVVITGAPSSGKTTTVNNLKSRGFSIIPEAADELRREGRQRTDEVEFNHAVLARKVENEDRLDPKVLIFLDRGIPDTIAYARYYGEDDLYAREASQERRYQRVFVLDQLAGYETTKTRIEEREFAEKMDKLLYQAYRDLGYDAIRVPVFSRNQEESLRRRSEFILMHLGIKTDNPSLA